MICGAEACNLGAMIHDAELRVHFLKSFQKGSTCENLSQKGLKIKKDGTACFSFTRRIPFCFLGGSRDDRRILYFARILHSFERRTKIAEGRTREGLFPHFNITSKHVRALLQVR
jgi:hypothetical protein